MTDDASSAHPIWIAAGVVLWALHFALVYGFTALACARGFGAAVPWVVGAVTLVGAAAAIALIALRHAGDFVGWMSASVAGFALLAIVWEGIAALMVKPCA